jgi:ankyrin repeat protein
LAQPTIDIHIKDNDGFNAVAVAFNNNNETQIYMPMIELLLEHGADPNSRYNNKPLICLLPSHLNVVNLLLKYGADPNLKDHKDQTVLTDIIKFRGSIVGKHVVKRLLEEPTLDVDRIHSDGKTYLLQAVLEGEPNASRYIKVLVDGGADPTICDANGRTARHYARSKYATSLLANAQGDWVYKIRQATNSLIKKFIVIRRLKQNGMSIERRLGEYIVRLAEYNSQLDKPRLIALAKSLYIPIYNKTKIELHNEISNKLII